MATQAEQIQAVILQTLDRDGSIPDTRQLQVGPGGAPLASAEDQIAVKAVLDSLWSKEVRPPLAPLRDTQIYRNHEADSHPIR